MGLWDTVKGVAGDVYNAAASPFRTGGALGAARPIEDPDPMTPERAAAMRENYLYGGSETGAADFNRDTRVIAQGYGDASSRTGNEVGAELGTMGRQQFNTGQQITGAGMNAFGADANRFVDDASLGGARTAADSLFAMSQQGAGPSVAEAQLRAGQAGLESQNMALATSGRGLGGGAAARRAAMGQNAQASGAMNANLATLRATEEANRRDANMRAAAAAGGLQNDIMGSVAGARGAGEQAATQRGLGLVDAGQRTSAVGSSTVAQGGDLSLAGLKQGADTELTGQQIQNQTNVAALEGTMGYEGNQTDRRGQEYQAAQATQDAGTKRQGALLGLGGAVLGMAGTLSDRRAKRDVKRVEAPIEVMSPGGGGQSSEAAAFADRLRALRAPEAPDRAPGGSAPTPTPTPRQAAETIRQTPAYSFRYEDPKRHGEGQRLGFMAQDLEKTPTGARAVDRGPDGLRRVDTGELETINTAAIHNEQERNDRLQERQDELDERLRRFASVIKPPDYDALDRAHERERSFGR